MDAFLGERHYEWWNLFEYILASITHHQNEWLASSEDFSVAESMLTRAPHKKITARAFVQESRDERL